MVEHLQIESLLIKSNAYIIGLWTDIKNGSKKKSHARILYSDILVQSLVITTSYVLLLQQPDLSLIMAMGKKKEKNKPNKKPPENHLKT